jgi:hypothetical protein
MRHGLKVTGSGIALAAALAGCSSGNSSSNAGSGGSSDGVHAVQAAYATTTAARTAKTTMKIQVKQGGAAAGQQLAVAATGGLNLTARSGALKISLPQGVQEQVVFAHKIAYEKLPAQALSQLGVRTPWISIDLDRLAKAETGSSLSQLQQQAPNNPMDELGYLKSASSRITKVGTAKLDGAATTHYRVVLDLDKQKNLQAIKNLEKATGSHNLPAQVWIDSAGRLRKLLLAEKLSKVGDTTAPNAAPVTVSINLGLSDFGAPVAINPPPNGQSTDITAKLTAGH